MLQSQMLRPPYDVSYLRRISENWRHRRGLWQMLVAVTYRTGPVRCPLPFYMDYSALPARLPYDALMFCKNNPAATVQPPYGHCTMLRLLYPNRTVTVRRLHGGRTMPSDISCKDNPAATVRSPYGGRTMLFVAKTSYDVLKNYNSRGIVRCVKKATATVRCP